MNSKIGGIPWSVTNMPYQEKPTMVVGLSSAKAKGGKSILAVSASVNSHFNRFV